LLKNLCNVQEMMWVSSASCFWDFLLERWWDKFNPGWCFWLGTIVKNLCHVREMTWVNNVSCFVKVHFRALMGQIQSGTLLLSCHELTQQALMHIIKILTFWKKSIYVKTYLWNQCWFHENQTVTSNPNKIED